MSQYLSLNPLNCGICGGVCESASCVEGECTVAQAIETTGMAENSDASDVPEAVCAAGQVRCSDTCTDLSSDPTNCGACGVVCESLVCTAATCASEVISEDPPPEKSIPSWDEGFTDCWGSCVDLLSDSQHCGACGVICDSGICEGGACQ
jgi:hypothetical protein